jgi:hypothetical protein
VGKLKAVRAWRYEQWACATHCFFENHCVLTHLWHLQISGLVGEAESGLRLALRTMGMRDSSYWTSWMAFDGLMAFFTALLLTVSGNVKKQQRLIL